VYPIVTVKEKQPYAIAMANDGPLRYAKHDPGYFRKITATAAIEFWKL
jgi:hypothetical protein